MDLSPNQYTMPMWAGSRHEAIADWEKRVDRLLVQQDLELRGEQAADSEAAEASLTELDEYLHTLSVEEHQAALDGLREYERHVGRDIDIGWHRGI